MASTPREIGTLIVVVLRANHLPNKRHIGKQDPYCCVTVNGEKRRTKAIKRGGQHPEWDEEIRFTLFEDVDDVLNRTAHGDRTPPPPPPKDDKKSKRIKGGKTMKLACYADDPREPDLIGEADVDLTEVLTKGETDEWFTLTNKEKFAGKVYLELTFWSNEPPPEKKATSSKVSKNNKQYGGPGSFTPSGEYPAGSRIASTYNDHSRQNSDVFPSSLRASNSAANLDLYVAPYERSRGAHIDKITQDFNEFGISGSGRRESFPPVPGQYAQDIPSQYSTITTYPPSNYHGYEQNIPGNGPGYTASEQMSNHFQQTSSSTLAAYGSQAYQPSYDVTSTQYQPTIRGPRHSVPTSSGFVPLPQASGFVPIASHVSEPSGFTSPSSHTPASNGYSHFNAYGQPAYGASVSHTPAPNPYLQHSNSLSSFPQQSSPAPYNYSYTIPSSVSAPPQQYISTGPPLANIAQPANTVAQNYPPLSQSHEVSQNQPPLPPPIQAPLVNGQTSRPLPPQPQVIYSQPVQSPPLPNSNLSAPSPNNALSSAGSYSPTQPGNIYPSNSVYASIPPPPPLQQYSNAPQANANAVNLSVPPPPPPPPSSLTSQRPRRASLPQPPVSYQQQNVHNQQHQVYQQQQQQPNVQGQPLPLPPPPPPIDHYVQNQLPLPPPPPPPALPEQSSMAIRESRSYQQLPPPKPPQVDEYGQWIQPNHQQLHQSSQAY